MDNNYTAQLPISLQELELLSKEILEGKFGKDGERFLSTKMLAQKRDISVVTAHRVLKGLCKKGLIELRGRKYYLSYGEFAENELNRHKIIGLHVNNISNEYYSSIAKEAEKIAKKNGYKLIVSESNYSIERENEILKMFQDIGVAGILSCPGVEKNTKNIYKNYPGPFVFIGRLPKDYIGQSIQINPYPVMQQIARHFITGGYKSFAYVGLSEIDISEDLRLFGFKNGLINEGYNLQDQHIFSVEVKNISKMSDSIKEFLLTCQKPIAIFCYHDLIALEVLKVCHLLKIEVPDEVGIVGFDNLSPTAYTMPGITTVDYHIDKMVDIAFNRLIKQIEKGKNEKINYFIELELIIRGSTDKNKI